MSQFAWMALIWLDWKLLVNRIRAIGRNPRRLIPWLLFLIWLIPSWINRVLLGSHVSGPGGLPTLNQLAEPVWPFVPGLAVLVFGLAVWRASNRPPAAFQSPADARFVIGAGLDSRAVFTWLALRTARRLIVSVVLFLILLQVMYLPLLGISGVWALAFTLALGIYGGIVFGGRLLAFNLQRAAPWLPVGPLGALLALLGIVCVSASLAQTTSLVSLPPVVDGIERGIPPGSWMLAAFGGNLLAELPLLGLAIGLTAAGIVLAGDCYPELWETSNRVFALRRALHSRGGLFGHLGTRSTVPPGTKRSRSRQLKTRSSSAAGVPAGSWTVLWKEWISARRGRGFQLQVALLSAAAVVGLVIGIAAGRGSTTAIILAGTIAFTLLMSSWAAGIQLGHDLGNPLWWLSSAPLWSRLAIWTLARSLRFAVPLIVFIEVAIAASGQDLWILGAAPLPPLLLCWLMQGMGLAVYSLLPARTDYRLALMLRMFALYVILVPLSVAFIPGAVLRNAVVLVGVPLAVVLLGIAGLIAFATWRIGGNGLVFAREERE